MDSLKSQGFERILSLEHGYQAEFDGNPKEESQWAQNAGIAYCSIPMSDFFPPKQVELYLALALIGKAVDYNHKIYVHCLHGVDRTGFVIAAYRVKALGWSWDQAYKELRERGFHLFWYWWWLPFLKHFLKL